MILEEVLAQILDSGEDEEEAEAMTVVEELRFRGDESRYQQTSKY